MESSKKIRSESAPKDDILNDFVSFLNDSPTNFHATATASQRYLAAGFTQLFETQLWSIEKGGKYFFHRNHSTIVAFTVGGEYVPGNGYSVLAAHTDSPCLKIKPVTCITKSGCLMVNTQPYGGGLWHTWFDRDLGIAGRVLHRGADGKVLSKNIRIDTPIARIPNLAIHLTSGKERDAFEPNLQEHAKAILSTDPAVLSLVSEHKNNRFHPAFLQIICEAAAINEEDLVDMELQLTDCQPASLGGVGSEFVYSGRLDNLCSSYQCMRALIDSASSVLSQTHVALVALFDHEEVGSSSYNGAGSSLLVDTLTLINESINSAAAGSLMRSLRSSIIVSVDMAHGLHPNYPSKHDSSMAPVLNKGMVIKNNSNQRYATNSVSASLFREAAKLAGINVQEFTVRSDSACGSTVGPILSTLSGILTVDCGCPQYSMHSVREMMAASDVHTGYAHLLSVIVNFATLVETFKPAM